MCFEYCEPTTVRESAYGRTLYAAIVSLYKVVQEAICGMRIMAGVRQKTESAMQEDDGIARFDEVLR
jgi:hypothetical protein